MVVTVAAKMVVLTLALKPQVLVALVLVDLMVKSQVIMVATVTIRRGAPHLPMIMNRVIMILMRPIATIPR